MAHQSIAEQKSSDESFETEIKNCQSAQFIKGLLTTLQRHTDQTKKLESEIASDLQQKHVQFTEPYIQTALNDAKKRLKWNIKSPSTDSYRPPIHCQVYSRSGNQWTDGIIDSISTEEQTEREWLTVKYGASKNKKIQRFCSDLKPIGMDDDEYNPKEEVMEYIAQRFRAAQNDENIQFEMSLLDTLEKEQYDVVQLLNHFHFLKYHYKLDDKDDEFDKICDFFKESMTGNECDVNECEHVRRHYRNRGGRDPIGQETGYNLLIDTVSMIHCYFVHSFDIDRFSKAERQQLSQHKGNEWTAQSDILTKKRERLEYSENDRRARFQGDDDDQLIQIVDFLSMAMTVEEEVTVLTDGLEEYERAQDRLIGDLIDVVFAENEENEKKMTIWTKLNVEDERKRDIFRLALCGHFNINQLSRDNMVKLSVIIITRKGLKIDMNALKKEMETHKIDGRIFDEANSKYYRQKSDFLTLFGRVRGCRQQDVGELYSALKDWLFVVYAVMLGLREIRSDTESESNQQCISENARKFDGKIIGKLLENPIGIDILQNDFEDRLVEHCGYKMERKNETKENEPGHAIAPMVALVKFVIDELKKNDGDWVHWEEPIIDFFRKNPDIEGVTVSSTNNKDLGIRMHQHCGGGKYSEILNVSLASLYLRLLGTYLLCPWTSVLI